METKRIFKIDNLSFVLSIFVVAIHNSTSAYYSYGNNIFNNTIYHFVVKFIPNITEVAVPLFFIISSFLFYKSFCIENTKSKLSSRIRTLLIPYLIWNCISLIVEAMIRTIPALSLMTNYMSSPFEIRNIISGVFLSKYNIFWFILALMIYNLLCIPIYKICQNRIMGLLSIIVLYLLFSQERFQINIPGLYFEITSVIYYFIGCYLGIHYKTLFNKVYKSSERIIALTLLIIILVFQSLCSVVLPIHTFLLVLKCFMIVIIIDLLINHQKQNKLARYTFFIYASHIYIERVLVAILRKLLSSSGNVVGLQGLLIYIGSLCGTLAICIFAARCLSKFFPGLYRILTGNR